MTTLPLWDESCPLPPFDEMEDLTTVTHVTLERAQPGGYYYLHESALAWHEGRLYACWANHPEVEINITDERIRGRSSADGGWTWSPAETWVEAPAAEGESFNHPVLASHEGRLWGFFTRWQAEQPGTAIFGRDVATGQWRDQDAAIPGFLPFRAPAQLADGTWIMSGEIHWYEAAVALSEGDFTRWEVVKIPQEEGVKLHFAETTLMDLGERLVAICRPREASTAPVATSDDGGRTWTPLAFSNFPLAESKPFCGRLSTGQHYLLSNHLTEARTLLTLAVTAPGGAQFRRIWKVRHQAFPRVRLFGGWGEGSRTGEPTEWSYPCAVERDGRLYVSYTQGKEDCVMSIIPVEALGV